MSDNISIPKILHFVSPKNLNDWHPLWKICFESWKKNFLQKGYDLIIWNDENDLFDIVNQTFPEYSKEFNLFEYDMTKIDFAKFCIMYKYGGIISDLDVFCYKNFLSSLTHNIFLLQSLKECKDELVQNSIMASEPNHDFFIKCIKNGIDQFYFLKDNKKNLQEHFFRPNIYPRIISGPQLLSKTYAQYCDSMNIKLLDRNLYNPNIEEYHENLYTKHMLTGIWDKSDFTIMKNEYDLYLKENEFITYENFIIKKYNNFRKIDFNKFDFYKNYNKYFNYN